MPKLPIHLGRSMSKMAEPSMPKEDEEHFPSLYLEWDSDYALPKSGTMTVKFKKSSESNSEDRDGKKRQNVSLDIISIESVKSGKSEESKDEDSGDHLDKLKKEVEEENAEKESEEENEY